MAGGAPKTTARGHQSSPPPAWLLVAFFALFIAAFATLWLIATRFDGVMASVKSIAQIGSAPDEPAHPKRDWPVAVSHVKAVSSQLIVPLVLAAASTQLPPTVGPMAAAMGKQGIDAVGNVLRATPRVVSAVGQAAKAVGARAATATAVGARSATAKAVVGARAATAKAVASKAATVKAVAPKAMAVAKASKQVAPGGGGGGGGPPLAIAPLLASAAVIAVQQAVSASAPGAISGAAAASAVSKGAKVAKVVKVPGVVVSWISGGGLPRELTLRLRPLRTTAVSVAVLLARLVFRM